MATVTQTPNSELDRPRESDTPNVSRTYAAEWWWANHDKDTYECPDCGRSLPRAGEFDVHHIDEDPTNNDPENLIALCRRCHVWRHHNGPTLKGLDVDEWKDGFLSVGEESP